MGFKGNSSNELLGFGRVLRVILLFTSLRVVSALKKKSPFVTALKCAGKEVSSVTDVAQYCELYAHIKGKEKNPVF